MNIDELIHQRSQYRLAKDYRKLDETRAILDNELVFVFDAKDGSQEIYYLTEKFFRKKPPEMTNRKYLESRIQADSRAERVLDAWIVTTNASLTPST
ncbi:MAG: hypothetical protein QM762_12790 [Chryseolinea sp.]